MCLLPTKEQASEVYMNEALFEKYVNLIRKRAHEYSESFGIDYSELESQGFLIYCQCLENYDCTKSSFCTHLYIELNRLSDYARTYNRQQGFLVQDYYQNENDYEIENNYEDSLQSPEYSLPGKNQILREAKKVLSKNAFQLMCWILGRSWERKNKRKPTIPMAMKHFNISKQAMLKLWEECGNFWKTECCLIYA